MRRREPGPQADVQALAIYKPRRGERPLWDFPPGTLCQREVATYVLSRGLDWSLVPPTVLRDQPYGLGAVQLYIDADPAANYFTLREEQLKDFLPVALFDLLTNNADRKGGSPVARRCEAHLGHRQSSDISHRAQVADGDLEFRRRTHPPALPGQSPSPPRTSDRR